MRQIGTIEAEAAAAAALGDYLYAKGIRNDIEHDKDRTYAVWVHDEDQLEQARSVVERFRLNPADPEFQNSRRIAQEQRAAEKADLEAAKRRQFSSRQLWPSIPMGLLTILLMVLSAGVFVISRMGTDMHALMPLFITEFDLNTFKWSHDLPEITQQGQVWRLVTPIFIHFGPMHILMNMLWLKDLGSQIEGRQGGFRLLLLVIVIAVVSNYTQFAWRIPILGGGAPVFGGMSGVDYGLLGYVWMQQKYDARFGFVLHPSTISTSLLWLLLCFLPSMHIANNAHLFGLLTGMLWGFLAAAPWRRKRPESYY